MASSPAPLIAALLLVLVPAVDAAVTPAVYLLKDAELADGRRVPLGDGELRQLPPAPLPDTSDPTNSTPKYLQEQQPITRNVYPFTDAVAPVQFVANATANTGHIRGVSYALLFLPKTPAMQSATLNVSLVALPAEPQVPPPLGGGGTVLAWGRIPLNYTSSNLPNATNFVPGNVSDPQSAVNNTAAQLLIYGFTTVASWMAVVILDDAVPDYVIDAKIDKDARLALRFVLENGTAFSPHPGVPPQTSPTPAGAGQPIAYDFAFTPSYVYVPWYTPDPPRVTTTTSKPPATTSSTAPTSPPATTSGSEPAVMLPFGLVVTTALAAAVVARRRLP